MSEERTDAENRALLAEALLCKALNELECAHRIIQNGMNQMTNDQKMKWAEANEAARVDGEGSVRYHEREKVMASVRGFLA